MERRVSVSSRINRLPRHQAPFCQYIRRVLPRFPFGPDANIQSEVPSLCKNFSHIQYRERNKHVKTFLHLKAFPKSPMSPEKSEQEWYGYL